jgi:hypothetical protein
MSTADYGILGIGPASEMTVGNAYVGAYATPVTTTTIDSAGAGGVYSGSLSSQGNMVAMQLNKGSYKYQGTGRFVTVSRDDGTSSTYEETIIVPYLSGYSRTYMRDPVACTFGADSPMPALTAVMPADMDVQGNMLYYLDLQLTRLTGSNYIDTYQFINVLNQAIAWVTTSNSYLAALNNAETTNLAYYRARSMEDFISQGFDKYKKGKALSVAFRNIGIVAETIPTGHFGSVNAVAKTLIDRGLGYINDFTARLLTQGVVYANILDAKYSDIINKELLAINNASDLDTIQEVLSSNIRNFRNPTDYCYIETASGLDNDSAFKNMAEVGTDLYTKAPGFNVSNGSQVADLIDNLQVDVPASVKALTTKTSLLQQTIIDNLRSHLPVREGNKPVTLLDIIGTSSGYLIDSLNAVNEGMQELYATSYGPQIRSLLEDISRYAARIPLNKDEDLAAQKFTISNTTGSDYYGTKLDQSIVSYYNLLNLMVQDTSGRIPLIVEKINSNYRYLCQQLINEHLNFNKAGLDLAPYKNNNSVYGFVGAIPGYATDSQNIGIDLMIYGTAQNNAAGDLVRTILNQSKNTDTLANTGVRITGIL